MMMNCRDCGEPFGLDESSPDSRNITGVWALCVHVNPTFDPHSDVFSNWLVTRDTVRYVAPLIKAARRTEVLIAG